jgi:hypothetical protein
MWEAGSRPAWAKKFRRPHPSGKKLAIGGACHLSDSKKFKIEGSWSRPSWVKKKTAVSKVTRAKWAW